MKVSMQKSNTRKFHRLACLLLLSLLCIFFDYPLAVGARTLPWASKKSYDCVNECIDKRLVFCSEAKFGFCCDPRQCGDQTHRTTRFCRFKNKVQTLTHTHTYPHTYTHTHTDTHVHIHIRTRRNNQSHTQPITQTINQTNNQTNNQSNKQSIKQTLKQTINQTHNQ